MCRWGLEQISGLELEKVYQEWQENVKRGDSSAQRRGDTYKLP